MIRSVGYCDNSETCDDYHKGVFLLNHGNTFYCPRCRQLGWVEEEKRTYRDLGGVDKQQAMYREARVKFDFRPADRKYEYTAVVSVDGLDHGAVFEITSPLVKTEKRALKLAEAALCLANSGRLGEESISQELRIDFDSPDWQGHIEHVNKVLTERDRRMTNAIKQDG
jgi:ribosomal protein S27AE